MKATIIIIAALSATTLHAADDGNMYPEGNFESPVQIKAPSSPVTADPLSAEEGVLNIEPGNFEALGCKVTVESDDPGSFLRLVAPDGFSGILRTYIALRLPEPAPTSLTIGQRWRLTGIAPASGAPEWAGAQNDPIFVLADGTTKTVNGTIRSKSDTLGEWQEVEKTVSVPEGARMLILQPGLYVASGTLEIDDIRVFAE